MNVKLFLHLLHSILSVSASLYFQPCSQMNIGGVVFPLQQQSKDEDCVLYHGLYDTEGVPHTKSGDRQPVQVSIEVMNFNNYNMQFIYTQVNDQKID